MTTLSDAEIIAEAKQHLRDQDNGYGPDFSGWAEVVRALIALAEQPRLPEEPTDSMLLAIAHTKDIPIPAFMSNDPRVGWPARVYHALRDHLAPKPKGWRVETQQGAKHEMISVEHFTDNIKLAQRIEQLMERGVRFTVVPL